jgi:hypothetical protein
MCRLKMAAGDLSSPRASAAPFRCFRLTYKTKAEAKEAHSLMIKVIEGAEITAHA